MNIEESRYAVLLQFLRTLDYVKIVQVAPNNKTVHIVTPAESSSTQPGSQLALLQQVLQQQSKPLFQNISDPVAWQNQQRDEWS
ncbi:MAG: hypothetical protein IPJ82_09785 [Lewinellaceae bacterium]|nr:hypothetical protein [Lewinellaceae bacterium]